MDEKSAKRLRLIGLLVFLICVLLLWLPRVAGEDVKYDEAIAGTLAIGIGLFLLAEIGPLVKSLKAGGIEVEFLDTVSDKFNALESRVAALEVAAQKATTAARGVSKPPHRDAVDLPKVTVADDPQKGRFGGEAERDGFKLSARFQNVTKNFVEIVLQVEALPGTTLGKGDCVDFYLHDTFHPNVVRAVFRERTAELSVISYGGFTVGALVRGKNVTLELDLSKVRGAPRIVRDL